MEVQRSDVKAPRGSELRDALGVYRCHLHVASTMLVIPLQSLNDFIRLLSRDHTCSDSIFLTSVASGGT